MANIKKGNYAFSKINLKEGIAEFSRQIAPQIELTLAFNPTPKKSKISKSGKIHHRNLCLDTVTKRYYLFIAQMNKKLFGAKCHKKKTLLTIKHFGVVEHLESNAHIHASIHLPNIVMLETFIKYGKWLWEEKIQPSGEFFTNGYSGSRWDNYLAKDIYTTTQSNLLLFGGK
jgi:hypothetical protein